MFTRDPGGGWPLGRQAGPPGEIPPTSADLGCRNSSPRRNGQSVSQSSERGGAAAPPRSASGSATLRRMERPGRYEHVRFLGDKRTQLVYDLDEWDDPAPIEDLLAAETGIC